jgi:beta-phosphoglucomutase
MTVTGPYAVIFDMDGVLVDTYHAHYRSFLEMALPEGLYFTQDEFAPAFGRTSREIIAHFWGNDRYDENEIAALDARKEASFRQIIETDFPAMPGIADSLESLHQAGFLLAVGSSGSPENIELILSKLGKRSLFSAIVTGKDVVRGKPDPQVFLLAAERLGVPPARCAVIEDAPAGVAAANAAGMTSVGLMSTGRTISDFAAACTVVRSLSELTPQMLRHLIDQRLSPLMQGESS